MHAKVKAKQKDGVNNGSNLKSGWFQSKKSRSHCGKKRRKVKLRCSVADDNIGKKQETNSTK